MVSSELSLTLRESSDLSEGEVRMDQSDLHFLGIPSGGTVVLKGLGHACYVRAFPANMEDRNQKLVRVGTQIVRSMRLIDGEQINVSALQERPAVAEEIVLSVVDDVDRLYIEARLAQIRNAWHDRIVVIGDALEVPTLEQHSLGLKIIAMQPQGPAQFSSATILRISDSSSKTELVGLAGLRDIYRSAQQLIDKTLRDNLSVQAKAILLTGPSGCGKAQLVKRLAGDTGAHLRVLDCHELLDRQASGATEIEGLLTEVAPMAPAIILLDHMEALGSLPSHHAIVTQLCAMLDELRFHRQIMLFGVCSEKVDPRLMAGERFDVVIPVDRPDRLARHEMLMLVTRSLPLDEKVDLQKIASVTRGCTMADLRRLVNTVGCSVEARPILQEDFTAALRTITPTTLTHVYSEVPDETWDDVGGLDDVKALLKETLSWSLRRHRSFIETGVTPPRSILISGANGVGKTLLVRALSNAMPMRFIEIACPALMTRNQESASAFIHDGFSLARRRAPCLIFLDDIDALFGNAADTNEEPEAPRPIVAQLLCELDRLSRDVPGVVVIAATKRPDRLTGEMMRPGRFDYALVLPMPDEEARKKILQIHSRKLPLSADVDFDKLAKATQGLSPADLTNVCNRVGLLALRLSFNSENGEQLPVVNEVLFDQVLRGHVKSKY